MPSPPILGVDFTSAPSKRKPITCAVSGFAREGVLDVERVERIESFGDYEALLARPGPWLGGFDHPFGQPVALLDGLGLPRDWAGYAGAVAGMGRPGFEARLRAWQAKQPAGSKEAHRVGDALAGASAPHKLVHPPVGKMFYEGATRLLAAGISVPPLHSGDPARIALEAYPALIARRFAGSYKAEERARQSDGRTAARRAILAGLRSARLKAEFGFVARLPKHLAEAALGDAGGDTLDAVLCAVQAGWAWTMRNSRRTPYGIPNGRHPTIMAEGWIVDPCLLGSERFSRP
ncbi:MAG: DUF429 domain-containing protein [Alphaproteobacteria bacterium]